MGTGDAIHICAAVSTISNPSRLHANVQQVRHRVAVFSHQPTLLLQMHAGCMTYPAYLLTYSDTDATL